ncbi:GNAT family N-acetyltransferase [Streptomyces zhihengii]|uniref:GNAT family N-acetyltransferase n=1 Tax=Streptomyces zhihengii TaxID=1818004 RepID=UPI00362E4358
MNRALFRDPWGIPHLRAGSPGELAYAQGHNAAADRAWQLEVDRHRAQGTSASFLGAEALPWDRFARMSRVEDTARRCHAALSEETADWIARYVDGVNDGLAAGASRMPQFAATGLAPGRWEVWTPIAVWLSTHILFAGFPTKLWREEVARVLGEDAACLFAADGPGTAGSNGWLVPGDRTASGAALIAGDPHRFIEDPGIYQQIRLACPEFDVVGLAVPGIPGIAHFGHTGSVAWAITNAMADYQDLYRERLRRRGPLVEALGPDGWRPAAVHTEVVEVAGQGPVTVEVVETERGPVVAGDADTGEALSLRCPARADGDIGFDALPALLRARTVEDVDRAVDRWVEPVNVVQAADTAGGLLHRVAGRVPRRHHLNRIRVVPAWEARHAWTGTYETMPRAAVDGVAVMANQRGIAAPLGVEFAPRHRAARIRELLDASGAWTGPAMAGVHTDTLLGSAEPLLALLARTDGLSPAAGRLRERLLAWDRHMAADSADAAAFAALRSAVVRRVAGLPALAPLAEAPSLPEVFHPWLAPVPRVAHALETLLAPDALPGLDTARVVREAAEEAAGLDTGVWGDTHRLVPWQALPDRPEDGWPALSGDVDCVLSTSSVPGVTDLSARGPAARYVWDLARREDSLWIVPLGASGVPGDPHQRDQLPLWAAGELVPVITDWDRLTEEKQMTEPAAHPREAVHEQHIEGFGTVRVLPLDPVADLDVVHGWVTEERARFWGMNGHTREEVREIYEYVGSLPTHHAFLVLLDDEPAALFQTYEPDADPVGECYEVRPGDFGVHLLVAPAAGGHRPGFTWALMLALMAYCFADEKHLRIVVEPDARNEKAIERMVRSGFVRGPVIDKPEKRAQLAFLDRAVYERRA